jgi:hypothetical protein
MIHKQPQSHKISLATIYEGLIIVKKKKKEKEKGPVPGSSPHRLS